MVGRREGPERLGEGRGLNGWEKVGAQNGWEEGGIHVTVVRSLNISE